MSTTSVEASHAFAWLEHFAEQIPGQVEIEWSPISSVSCEPDVGGRLEIDFPFPLLLDLDDLVIA